MGDTTAARVATQQSVQTQTTDPQRSTVGKTSPGAGFAFAITGRLQRAIGNRALRNVLRNSGIQRKLAVSDPNDKHEREADRVADEVMRSASPQSPVASGVQGIQLAPSGPSEDDTVQPQTFQLVDEVLRSSGQSLDKETRSFMDSRFGYDFTGVRVHTGQRADRSARELNALAYTVGSDIVFASGHYNPRSEPGKRLIAHELTHVMQQSNDIRPYRNKGHSHSVHFGENDTAALKEDSFDPDKDKETKPWIETITVKFTATQLDTDGVEYWVGEGVAKYYKGKKTDVKLNLSGGPKGRGKTKKGTFTVKRIEGVGYMSSSYSDPYVRASKKGWGRRYAKDKQGNMNYAVFFYGGQALHSGPADLRSHGCVHADWVDETPMQQVNYHSVVGLTKVIVEYP